MESIDSGFNPQVNTSTIPDKKPGLLRSIRENVFNRFADPRDCRTLKDVVGLRVEDRIAEARRLDWVPRKLDIARMVEAIKLVEEQKNEEQPLKIVDVAGHSGFLDRLLLDEMDKQSGVHSDTSITVVDPDKIVTNKARRYYKGREERLDFKTETIQENIKVGNQADIVICSWMRPEMDLRPEIEKLNPKVIIFVKDIAGDVGQKHSFEDSDRYEQVSAWLGFSGHDVDSINKRGDHEATNVVLIMRKRNESISQQLIKDRLNSVNVGDQEKYPWESQLPSRNIGKIRDVDNFDYFSPVQD